MSATGRSDVRDSQDVYETWPWITHRLLEAVDLPGGLWLEPCAGSGKIITATSAVRSDVIWHAVELRENCIPLLDYIPTVNAAVLGNFLAVPPDDRYAVCLSNPPFKSALKFVQHGLLFAPILVFLLRLDWLAPAKQSRWVRNHMPDVNLLPNHPEFSDGGDDPTEYAWMRFERGERLEGKLKILAETPLAERKGVHARIRTRGQRELFDVEGTANGGKAEEAEEADAGSAGEGAPGD